jgi:ATP-binding cassette, subfamily B, bacterial
MGLLERNGGRTKDVRTLRRVAQAFCPYKWQIILVIVAILGTTLLGLVDPFVVRSIFDDAIGKRNARLLVLLVSIMIVMPMLRGMIDIGEGYLSNRIGQGVMRDFRKDLYAHLQRMSLHFFTTTRTGEIQSRLSNDVAGVQAFVTYTAPTVVTNIATALSSFIAMIVISPLLTLISLGLLPAFLWMTGKVGNVRRVTSEETQNCLARLSSLVQETLSVSGILLMKTFGRQQYAQERFNADNQKLTELEVRQQMVGRWVFMLMDTLFSLTPAIIFLVAGVKIIRNPEHATVTLGGVVAFTALQMRLFSPLQQLLHVRVEMQGALALFDRIFEYLDLPVDIQDAPNAIHLKAKNVRGKVTFSRVSFAYKCDKPSAPSLGTMENRNQSGNGNHLIAPDPVATSDSLSFDVQADGGEANPVVAAGFRKRATLHNVSFEIEPGKLAALVGPSGAGKTTLTYLLPRLYDVDSGSVAIDGHDIRQIALASLGELIGVVTQETYLFHTSVRENLLFARSDATNEEMIAAAKAAAIHDRIMELPECYDTIVGERGYKLSGGEKQRLAIARVILKDPRILILDEATSALDTHSERLIQAALGPLMKKRTTLAIAHRLSTILAADVILVVDKGEIVERGTHDELLERGALYARLYNEQFSGLPYHEVAA